MDRGPRIVPANIRDNGKNPYNKVVTVEITSTEGTDIEEVSMSEEVEVEEEPKTK